MFRRSLFIAAAIVVAAQMGCQSRCGERHSWFTSRAKSDVPCQTVGRNTGCFDAATGQPVPCPPGVPSTVIPGGVYPPMGPMGPVVPGGSRPYELPMPAPTDMIRPPAIPFPAPPPPNNDALLPLPSSPGTPVKGAPNK